jgi:DNA-binding GntR family transcriptional regulator
MIFDQIMKLDPIPTKTFRQLVYDQLKKKIISAEIQPGQVMTLQGLAEQLGVSLMPIREALRQLETEQAIIVESNKRVYVNTLTAPEMEEILRIRLVLESMAAEAACELRPDSSLPKIKALLDTMEANVADPKKHMIANSQFHLGIYAYAESPFLLRIIEMIWSRIGPYLVISSKEEGNLDALRWHQGMFEAFAGKDKKRMSECLHGDLSGAARIIIPSLKSSMEPSTDKSVWSDGIRKFHRTSKRREVITR